MPVEEEPMKFESLARLSDIELLAHVRRLVHSERRTTAALVAHLGEIEDHKLYLQGCSSLFGYVRRLSISRSTRHTIG